MMISFIKLDKLCINSDYINRIYNVCNNNIVNKNCKEKFFIIFILICIATELILSIIKNNLLNF